LKTNFNTIQWYLFAEQGTLAIPSTYTTTNERATESILRDEDL